MAEPYLNRYAAPGWASQAAFDEGLRRHMLQVYNYMMIGLALTGIVAYIVGTTPALYMPIFGSPLKWVVMLAPLAFVFFFSFKIQSMSAGTAQLTFWIFCGVMGLSMASIFLVFTGASIARVFFITAGMFGAASLYGYTTKADLTKMGSFLFMGLIGIVIASLVNIFIGSSAVQFAISVIGGGVPPWLWFERQKPAHPQTSYYQPVRLRRLKRSFLEGRIDRIDLGFTNPDVLRAFRTLNAPLIDAGLLVADAV